MLVVFCFGELMKPKSNTSRHLWILCMRREFPSAQQRMVSCSKQLPTHSFTNSFFRRGREDWVDVWMMREPISSEKCLFLDWRELPLVLHIILNLGFTGFKIRLRCMLIIWRLSLTDSVYYGILVWVVQKGFHKSWGTQLFSPPYWRFAIIPFDYVPINKFV